MDTWEASFRRQQRDLGDHWFDLMRTSDQERIDRLLGLAESTLPLDDIATGPGMELGIGPAFRHHGALDFIRNRNMAIRALADWGMPRWPEEAYRCITDAAEREPDEEVKTRLESLLQGRPAYGMD